LVITTPELPAITDADRVIGLLDNAGIREENVRLIINRFKARMVKRGDMLTTEDIKENLAVDLMGIIPDSEDIIVSSNRGIPVILNGNKGRNSVGRVFENIASRLRGEMLSIDKDLETTPNKGFLELIKRIFGRN
jgi:septum site-determining protein MinD